MPAKPIRELRKCLGCPKYFWTVNTPHSSTDPDSNVERLRYCRECWENRMQKPTSLTQIEHENEDGLTEAEKQIQNTREENELYDDYSRRYRAN